MRILAIRSAAVCIYALLAYLGAAFIWEAVVSVALYAGFFAWNIASAVGFVYAVTRSTGKSIRFVLPVVFCGSLFQLSTVAIFVQESLGETFGFALRTLPIFVGNVVPAQPVLFAAWLGLPVLVAYITLYLNSARSRVDVMHT